MQLRALVIVISGLTLGGCSSLYRGAPTYASPPMTIEQQVQFDIAMLLGSAKDTRLETAIMNFSGSDAERNRVTGALLLASDRNCDLYLENLRGYQSAWRTAFSLAGVGLGAAGAIVTGADTARLLSGLTGAASGAQGKLDENLMGGMASEILVSGVRAGREPIRAEIVANMQKSYVQWPVELAIADVIRYHGRCNVVSGLTTAQRAVEQSIRAPEPGGRQTPVTPPAPSTPPTTVPRI